MTTEAKLRKILSDMLLSDTSEAAANPITDSTSLIDDLGADSLDAIEIVMEVEEEFGIEIDDAAMEECQTFGDLRKMVEALI